MRRLAFLTLASLCLGMTAQAASKAPSRLSAFAGPHNGTGVVLDGFGGATTGKFTASKKKEVGGLVLSTAVNLGGSFVVVTEQFTFKKNSITWNVSSPVLISATGSGSAHVSKNTITYSIPITLSSGGTTYAGTLSGRMMLAKNNSLQIFETASVELGNLPFFYQLNGRKPKK